MTHRILAAAGGVAAAVGAAACTVTSYLDPARPFFETRHGVPRDTEPGLRVVTFNIKEGRRIAEATSALAAQRT